MAKYATTGNLLWSKVLENQTSGSGYDGLGAASMEINANGIIYLSGGILGHIAVDMDPGVNNFIIQNNFTYYINGYDAGGGTAYIAKYNASGAFISAERIISNANTAVTKLCFDNNDNIYCTGYMYDKPDFDPSAETFTLNSAGNSDIFFAKYTTAVAGPLPVTLLSFTGQSISGKHLLKWTTATEQNNKGFELQQSADGYSFQPIGWMTSLASSGNSGNRLSYTYSNLRLLPGINFYRLKQIDKDGKINLSPIVQLENKRKSDWTFSIYPNPVAEVANVVVNTSITQAVQFSLFSAEGKMVWAKKQTLQIGQQSIEISMKTLPGGAYRLMVQGSERTNITISKK
jgi:hypothetical protein